MRKLLMMAVVSSSLMYYGCHSEGHTHEGHNKHHVTSPIRMDTSIVKDYVCQIKSYQHIELRAQERGYLQNIYVDEGQRIKEGQLMFRIMPRLYSAEVQKAAAEAELAEIEYANTKSLADSDVVSQNELAMTKAKLAKAQAELSLAQVHLDFTEIRAPFNGIMDRFRVRLGSLVDEGELLTTLSDNSKMWVYFNVPEAEYLEYQSQVKPDSNVRVNLKMANDRIFKYPGMVETIEADFNNETGNIAFRAVFPNPEGLLRHGETGSLLMTVPVVNALIIPQKCTYDVLDKKYVYVLDEQNVLRAKQISVAYELPHLYVIKDGLTEDDRILLEGLRKVRDGDTIEPDYKDPTEVVQHLDLYAE